MNTRCMTISALGLRVLMLAACGGGSEQAREDQLEGYAARYGVDADVEVGDDGEISSVTINRGGGQVGSNLALPENFPDDVAVYPGLDLYSVAPTPGGGLSAAGRTEDGMNAVADFYAMEMSDHGWIDSSPPQIAPNQRMLRFSKGARNAMFTLVPIDTGTAVNFTLIDIG